jgi:hypothetical protein
MQFSGDMVLTVLVQLLYICLERAAYLYRSVPMRLVLQYIAAFMLHFAVWYTIPILNQQYLSVKFGLVSFYVLQCVYLGLGAAQIREGFVFFPLVASPVTKYGFGAIPSNLFKTYMAIPFLFEMKCLLDWWCASTSLDVTMWFQTEQIFAQLFNNACKMNARRLNQKVVQGHTPQPLLGKFINGLCIFSVLFAILLGPMVMFSSINPSLEEVPHTRVV